MFFANKTYCQVGLEPFSARLFFYFPAWRKPGSFFEPDNFVRKDAIAGTSSQTRQERSEYAHRHDQKQLIYAFEQMGSVSEQVPANKITAPTAQTSAPAALLEGAKGGYRFVIVKTFVVDRTQVEVLDDQAEPLLTLVTCTPVGAKNPRERLIVQRSFPRKVDDDATNHPCRTALVFSSDRAF